MKKILSIVLVISFASLMGQDLNSHYLYQLNWFNINPALTGSAKGTQVIINPGTQWVGLDDNPTTAMLGIHGKMDDRNSLGGKVIFDITGIFSTLSAEVLYSYKVKLTEQQNLRFGVSAGVLNTSLDQSALSDGRYTDLSDPNLRSAYYNQTRFMAGFGISYTYENLQIGLSSPHMVVGGNDISDHFFGTAKYDFKLTETKFEVSPMLVYQNLTNSEGLLDIGAKVQWNEAVWIQGAYRTNKNVALGVGVEIKNMSVGYLYNIFNSPLNSFSSGSQQVYLAFTFKPRPKSTKTKKDIEANSYERLNAVLKNLKKVSDAENEEEVKEIEQIQKELSDLITKMENNTYNKSDEASLIRLEARIRELKLNKSK